MSQTAGPALGQTASDGAASDGASPRDTPQLIHEDARLRVTYLPARGVGARPSELVVAFSGIGHGLGGMQTEEFAGSAAEKGGRNHVLFITDKQRSWFSAPGLMDEITDHVRKIAAQVGVSSCVTIGNSMGGYGAVRLSREFPVSCAVAFSPQFSMHPEIVVETRWEEHRPFIDLARHLPLSDCMAPPARYYLVFGGSSRSETKHRDLFPVFDGVTILSLPGAGHNIVQKIKDFGLLTTLVQALFAHDTAQIEQIVARYHQSLAAAAAETASKT